MHKYVTLAKIVYIDTQITTRSFSFDSLHNKMRADIEWKVDKHNHVRHNSSAGYRGKYRYMQMIFIMATYAALLDTFVVGLRARPTNCIFLQFSPRLHHQPTGTHWDFGISSVIKSINFKVLCLRAPPPPPLTVLEHTTISTINSLWNYINIHVNILQG